MRCSVQLRSAKIPGLTGLIADHYWFVVDKSGEKDRWEIWQEKNCGGQSWHHLHKNLMNYDRWVGGGESTVVHQWLGDLADRLISQIELHILTLTFGVKFKPFQLILPFFRARHRN